ncbi:hypothetical protein C3941_17790 [Kaistia algarum]|uniref:hypothetical protein n=1 Tax=Kaistia algarum TaxID=2083279 RepID=UPI000CE7447B|nr:hypothetical protein [Kaistia algarum]MCX5516728.1 hypothetical protein [Kaistia algarum]PPE78620.1 hypothetical protein C3941_17790 [Kaistia algarum]
MPIKSRDAAAVLAVALVVVTGFAGTAFADTPTPPASAWITMGSAEFYAVSFKALTLLFVMAVLIESALAVIFNWRLFLELFYGRGVRTLVMIAVSALAVWAFNIDVVQSMLGQYGLVSGEGGGPLSHFLTALILAGGSAGVYRILVALGYRQAPSEAEIRPKPKKENAWISVKVQRRSAVGQVYVRVTEAGPVTDASPPQLAGIVAPRGFWAILGSVFLLDRNRFPLAGGYEVEVAKEYRIEVTGRDAAGAIVASDIDGTYRFAPGAILDFTARL